MFLHPRLVLKASYYATRQRLKRLFGFPEKTTTPVLEAGFEAAVSRHRRICQTLLDHIPSRQTLFGATVCEVGCGDCLAAGDMMLGLGAAHVHLVEYGDVVVTQRHRDALMALVGTDLPNRGQIVAAGSPPKLATQFATFHRGLLEDIRLPEKVDFLYSFDVLEHVEDLDGFFRYCGEAVRPGGIMVHKFDLSGHEFLEDPIPPLDFQTYPDWLYTLMFPKYRRAVRNFLDQFENSIRQQGFEIGEVYSIRQADRQYLDVLWPKLRTAAREKSKSVIGQLDVVIIAKKL